MMTTHEFERLLLQPESNILDFKRDLYDFSNDYELKKTADFIKDIISFSNTIRNETAYIVIGVSVLEDGSKELIGLQRHIDDSIFQEKVKSKTNPRPQFFYYTFEYRDLLFGIFEIPVVKYDTPISTIVKLRGLEPGKFYHRRGSSNSEANGYESISISKWLEGLHIKHNVVSFFDKKTAIISILTQKDNLLSDCITRALALAENFNLTKLKIFCSQELKGFNDDINQESIKSALSYRTNKVLFTPAKLHISPYFPWDSKRLMEELKNMQDVYEQQMFFSYSVIYLEEIADKLSQSKNMLMTIEMPAIGFINEEKFKDVKVTVYASKDTIDNLLRNIRQKLLDELLCTNISPE